ncbi:hypothetical protein [Blautia wexlerae]|uniref:hypothetical protein n=1 Tax=Blautia wexlerae TaxID=418240 RepID=UPI000B2361D6|nr:hypothetical protein [Blautia wexlerae]
MRLLIGPAADFSSLLHINHFIFSTKYKRRRENIVANKTSASLRIRKHQLHYSEILMLLKKKSSTTSM